MADMVSEDVPPLSEEALSRENIYAVTNGSELKTRSTPAGVTGSNRTSMRKLFSGPARERVRQGFVQRTREPH